MEIKPRFQQSNKTLSAQTNKQPRNTLFFLSHNVKDNCVFYFVMHSAFCSIAGMERLSFKEEGRKTTDEVRGRRKGEMKETGLQKSQQGASFFLCFYKSCFYQSILLGQAVAAKRRHSGRETGEISALYI